MIVSICARASSSVAPSRSRPNHSPFERRCERDGQPKIVVVHEGEAFRHNADDRRGDVVDIYGGVDGIRVLGETPFPEPMADDGHGGGGGRFIGA